MPHESRIFHTIHLMVKLIVHVTIPEGENSLQLALFTLFRIGIRFILSLSWFLIAIELFGRNEIFVWIPWHRLHFLLYIIASLTWEAKNISFSSVGDSSMFKHYLALCFHSMCCTLLSMHIWCLFYGCSL